MAKSDDEVETSGKHVQWTMRNLDLSNLRTSVPFKIGNWEWYLTIAKQSHSAYPMCYGQPSYSLDRVVIKLYLSASIRPREGSPIASFVIRLLSSVGDRKPIVHPEILDKEFKSGDFFSWETDLRAISFKPMFIIAIEFKELKIASLTGEDQRLRDSIPRCNAETLSGLSRMLSNNIHTDITISASNGIIQAHRAILASRSPVFSSMFSHNLKEKESSIICIPDMSIEACQAFLNYIYGNLQRQEFIDHCFSLIRASDKYDISDLKEACEETFIEEVTTSNVLEALQNASLYQLPKLKATCIRFLVQFGKILDIKEEFNAFLANGDRDLIADIFREVLLLWEGF